MLNWFGIMTTKLICALQEQSLKPSANTECCTSSAGGTELKCHSQHMIQWSAALLSQFFIVPVQVRIPVMNENLPGTWKTPAFHIQIKTGERERERENQF